MLCTMNLYIQMIKKNLKSGIFMGISCISLTSLKDEKTYFVAGPLN